MGWLAGAGPGGGKGGWLHVMGFRSKWSWGKDIKLLPL